MKYVVSVLTALVCFSLPAWANDVLPLPQSVADLNPVIRQDALPPASGVAVGIPANRVAPASPRAKDVLRLAPGKSANIELSRDAASVIVANPTHASVFLDNPRLVVIVPRAPGATGFTVLDREGKTILSQQIMVDQADDPSYVRVTRICGASGTGSSNCVPSTVYYCPDNCVPVALPPVNANATNPQQQALTSQETN